MKFCTRIVLIPTIYVVMAYWCVGSAEESRKTGSKSPQATASPSVVADVVTLSEPALTESSGLAISRRDPEHFWSHNDSGGRPRLFAFNRHGRRTGQLSLNGAKAIDWEDMASYTDDGVARLLIADCGDNQSKRPSVRLLLLDEPDPTKSTVIEHWQTLTVTYADGPRDCEAVAVDTEQRRIVLVAKSFLPAAGVYVVPLPPRKEEDEDVRFSAKQLATVAVPMVTAMDIDPTSGDLWIANYFHACLFARQESGGGLPGQLAGMPRVLPMPSWKQIEALAVDAAHQAWVTSEGNDPPLGRLLVPGKTTESSP